MKIVDRKTFLALPPDTVYAKFQRHVFGDLAIKGESLANDWYYQPLSCPVRCNDSGEYCEILQAAIEDPTRNVALDFDEQFRDGLFDADQLFAVYDSEDLKGLITALAPCL